jgi:hypothetical protein
MPAPTKVAQMDRGLRVAARITLQAVAYGAFAFVIVFFSIMPPFRYASPDMASVKLSLSHATERVEPCVQLTPQQIAKLAPNMRRAQQCVRERLPLYVEVDIDGDRVVQIEARPSGLWSDGPASVYERFAVPPGAHTVTARLRDSAREEGWDYTHTEEITLEPGRYFTVTFKAGTGGFRYR